CEPLPYSVEEAVAGSPRPVHDEPVLVPAVGRYGGAPGGAAVERLEHVHREIALQALVVEDPRRIDVQHGVASEGPRREDPRKGPGPTLVERVGPATLTEVGGHRVELPPADDHVRRIQRIHG